MFLKLLRALAGGSGRYSEANRPTAASLSRVFSSSTDSSGMPPSEGHLGNQDPEPTILDSTRRVEHGTYCDMHVARQEFYFVHAAFIETGAK